MVGKRPEASVTVYGMAGGGGGVGGVPGGGGVCPALRGRALLVDSSAVTGAQPCLHQFSRRLEPRQALPWGPSLALCIQHSAAGQCPARFPSGSPAEPGRSFSRRGRGSAQREGERVEVALARQPELRSDLTPVSGPWMPLGWLGAGWTFWAQSSLGQVAVLAAVPHTPDAAPVPPASAGREKSAGPRCW